MSASPFYGFVNISVLKLVCLHFHSVQVFLLDSQQSSGAVIDYDVEEDRSYIFLIYPPGHDLGDDQPMTRLEIKCSTCSTRLVVVVVVGSSSSSSTRVVVVARSSSSSSSTGNSPE